MFSLLDPPHLYWVTALMALTFLALLSPELRRWLDRTERIIDRSEAEMRREQRHRVKPLVRTMQRKPWLSRVRVVDFDRGIVEGDMVIPTAVKWRFLCRRLYRQFRAIISRKSVDKTP